MEKADPLFSWFSLLCYLEHVCIVIVAVLHHHRLVTGQSERDAVLPPAVDGLQQQQEELTLARIFWKSPLFSWELIHWIELLSLLKSPWDVGTWIIKIKLSFFNIALEKDTGLIVI